MTRMDCFLFFNWLWLSLPGTDSGASGMALPDDLSSYSLALAVLLLMHLSPPLLEIAITPADPALPGISWRLG